MKKKKESVSDWCTSLPPHSTKVKRHKENKEKARRFREKGKVNAALLSEDGIGNNPEQVNKSPERVIIKMNFKLPTKKTSSRKRVSRGLAKAHKKINSWKKDNVKLQRKAWLLQKKVQRTQMKKPKQTPATGQTESSPKTPRGNSIIRKAGMSPKNVPRPIRKQLVFTTNAGHRLTGRTSLLGTER